MKINVEFSNLGDMVNFAEFVMNQSDIRVDKKKLEDYERMLANAQTQLERAYAKINGAADPYIPDVDFNNIDNETKAINIWFTVRTTNCLRSENIVSLKQLLNFTANELLKTPNFGRKSLKEVRDELAKYKLKLKGDL